MGNALKGQGKLEEAIEAFNKAIKLRPENAEANNNMGNALKEQGRSAEAVVVYRKALSLKPDYAEAYNNLGILLQNQGKRSDAVEAFDNALSINPNYAAAHHNLSDIKIYTSDDQQFRHVEELCKRKDLSEDERCHLSFALAKMYDDIGELEYSFKSFI